MLSENQSNRTGVYNKTYGALAGWSVTLVEPVHCPHCAQRMPGTLPLVTLRAEGEVYESLTLEMAAALAGALRAAVLEAGGGAILERFLEHPGPRIL